MQIIPFTAGGYSTMNGSCTIVDYDEPEAVPGVYLEYPAEELSQPILIGTGIGRGGLPLTVACPPR